MKPVFITADEAIKALPEYEKIHSFRSFIGADWDREAVIEAIKEAKRIAWIDDLFGHDLAIEDKDRGVVRFDVKKPEKGSK